jgi:hypothetical protein
MTKKRRFGGGDGVRSTEFFPGERAPYILSSIALLFLLISHAIKKYMFLRRRNKKDGPIFICLSCLSLLIHVR